MNTIKQNKLVALFVGACGFIYIGGVALTAVPTANSKTAAQPEPVAAKPIDVATSIRNRCFKKWGTDFRMVDYCINLQTEAARNLGL